MAGVRHGENSAMRALCVIAQGRDDTIYWLRKELHQERNLFRSSYEDMVAHQTGAVGITKAVSEKLIATAEGLPEPVGNQLLRLADALDRIS